ncbi:helix-turn-helix transcriptional regulator [Pedobacter sp. PLR]|uniref:helix-turn-helix domain-containing protein n=1 Tax=Pedobacter sp. PLR TaxID=2994465 RepID=UPI00224514C5|nr:helix-turn-helix transcriptional regulator [Pedobacter sp. PLR]MCX2449934.1 helix-turn-helix transcriptional regulator [Pedobacter sp. PLR]
MTPNRGDVIERVVRKKIGISELSRKLHVSRTAIYNWFEYGQVNLETICKIGEAIDYDFTKEFPEEFASAQNLKITENANSQGKQDEDGNHAVDYWMTKYISLLEKYNDLLVDMTHTNSNVNLNPRGPEHPTHLSIR